MQPVSITITTKTLWTVLLMVIGVFVAWELRSFLMVILLSVVIASFAEAGIKVLGRVKVPRGVAAGVLYVVGFAVIAGVLYLVVPLFSSEFRNFVELFPKTSYLYRVLQPISSDGFNTGTIRTLFNGSTDVFATLGAIFGGLLNAILVVIISFYLSTQERGIEQFLHAVIPHDYEDYAVSLWLRVERKIGHWFGGQVFVAVLIGLVTYIGLFIIGVPYALILSALAAVFVFVPFGTAFSLIPAVALGYLGGGVGLALQIFVFYGIVHYLESYFLSPYILHRTVGVPMLVMILSVIACFELFGLVGIVVAIPIAVLVLELISDHGKRAKTKESLSL